MRFTALALLVLFATFGTATAQAPSEPTTVVAKKAGACSFRHGPRKMIRLRTAKGAPKTARAVRDRRPVAFRHR